MRSNATISIPWPLRMSLSKFFKKLNWSGRGGRVCVWGGGGGAIFTMRICETWANKKCEARNHVSKYTHICYI